MTRLDGLKINMFSLVAMLRHYRPNMVQNRLQYAFLYDFINYCLNHSCLGVGLRYHSNPSDPNNPNNPHSNPSVILESVTADQSNVHTSVNTHINEPPDHPGRSSSCIYNENSIQTNNSIDSEEDRDRNEEETEGSECPVMLIRLKSAASESSTGSL